MGKYPELKNVDLTNFNIPLEKVVELVTSIINAVKPQKNYGLPDFSSEIDNLTALTNKSFIKLAENGWFIPSMDFSIDIHYELAAELVRENIEMIDKKICELIDTEFDKLKKDIINSVPHRGRLIEAACSAHISKEYALSIPVFLSQTDGICKDKINKDFFGKTNGLPQTASFVDSLGDSYTASLLAPFKYVIPITATEKQRDINSISLNRHKVLHGEDYQYDTELNSYKSFSLLSYVSSVLQLLNRK